MEVKKYKNISLRIIKEFQSLGQKVPNFANALLKEENEDSIGVGMKKEKSESKYDLDNES